MYLYTDFILLPILFVIVKFIFFKPYGIYEGYNALSLTGLLLSPIYALRNFIYFWLDFLRFFNEPAYFLPTLIIAFGLYKFYIVLKIENSKNDLYFLLLGFFCFFIGTWAYAIIGRPPLFYDWISRDQILLPLGVALIIVYGLKSLFSSYNLSNGHLVSVYFCIISLCAILNFKSSIDYLVDAFKQEALVEAFKNSKIIKENTSFIVEDFALNLNAKRRVYRYYEYNGLLFQAFRNEKRFMSMQMYSREEELIKKLKNYPEYRMRRFDPKPPEYKIIIKSNLVFEDNWKLITFVKDGVVNSQEFKQQIKNMVYLEEIKIENEK